MNENKKILISSVIGIATLVLLVFGATYAYFAVVGANNTYNTSITANVALGGGNFEATTASFNFDVSLENMSVSKSGSIAGLSDTSNIVVTATAPEGAIMTCTYDIDFAWKDGDRYTDYSNRNEIETSADYIASGADLDNDDYPEFWLTAYGETGTNNFDGLEGQYNLTKITKDGSSIEHVIEEASITVYGGRTNARRWLILSGINNLDVNQNSISGKNYAFDLSVTNVKCELEPVGNTTYTPQMGDLYEINGETFYYLGHNTDDGKYYLLGANPLHASEDPLNEGHYIVKQSNQMYEPTKLSWTKEEYIDSDGVDMTTSIIAGEVYNLYSINSPINTVLEDYENYINGNRYDYDVKLTNIDILSNYADNLNILFSLFPQDGLLNYGFDADRYKGYGIDYSLYMNVLLDENVDRIPLNTEHYLYSMLILDSIDGM